MLDGSIGSNIGFPAQLDGRQDAYSAFNLLENRAKWRRFEQFDVS